MTSTYSRLIRLFVGMVWLVMLLQGLIYVARYALINPYVDEWEFVDVLFREQPAGPWLWQFHNEHRFPLPRVLYLTLFWTTGDLRTGCYVTFLGIALTAYLLMRTAQRLRGGIHVTDAIFPLLLLHVGQDENLYMGYQMCFMLPALFAAILLRLILYEPSFARALLAGFMGVLLLTCGAGGLALGWCATVWLWVNAVFVPMRPWQRAALFAFSSLTPLYTYLYFDGYVRPSHHPPSAGLIESIRIALQAQGMSFGPSAQGLWPVFGVLLLLVGIGVVLLLLWHACCNKTERVRALGLLLFIGASAGVAFGIGWGRSGFHNNMGFAWRYGLLLAPTIWGGYFALQTAGPRVVTISSYALLATLLMFTPVNSISGFRDGETLRARERAWEADVRAGMSADDLLAKYQPKNLEWAQQLRMFRQHRYAYYEALGAVGGGSSP